MIGRLTGRVVESEGDGTVILDVGGVGYELMTPLGTLGRAGREDGTTVLHVHTHVREDALELFGFATEDERVAFRTLIGISKVGPKLAMAVLSGVSVAELARLVATWQVGLLTKIPGVGKRTAERMVLELKGKLSPVSLPGPVTAKGPVQTPGQATVLAEALVRMGFRASDVDRAVAGMAHLDRPMGELIREALSLLSP